MFKCRPSGQSYRLDSIIDAMAYCHSPIVGHLRVFFEICKGWTTYFWLKTEVSLESRVYLTWFLMSEIWPEKQHNPQYLSRQLHWNQKLQSKGTHSPDQQISKKNIKQVAEQNNSTNPFLWGKSKSIQTDCLKKKKTNGQKKYIYLCLAASNNPGCLLDPTFAAAWHFITHLL